MEKEGNKEEKNKINRILITRKRNKKSSSK
jgi:hypothetical protein